MHQCSPLHSFYEFLIWKFLFQWSFNTTARCIESKSSLWTRFLTPTCPAFCQIFKIHWSLDLFLLEWIADATNFREFSILNFQGRFFKISYVVLVNSAGGTGKCECLCVCVCGWVCVIVSVCVYFCWWGFEGRGSLPDLDLSGHFDRAS